MSDKDEKEEVFEGPLYAHPPMRNEAAFLVFLYGTAEGLEEYTYAKTRHSIRKLLDLTPKEARILKNGREKTIPAEELKVGDIFIVRPGESIPTVRFSI